MGLRVGSRGIIGNECAPFGIQEHLLASVLPLVWIHSTKPCENNWEDVARLSMVMFLETSVVCSALNQTLMVGYGDRIKARMGRGCH